MPRVYTELRQIARHHLSRNPAGHTLCTTALIHEAYLRLADAGQVTERGRGYFFAAAARAMRQVLVDYARRRHRLKRGGGFQPLTLKEGLVGTPAPSLDLVDLDRALQSLTEIYPRAASVVECRFFGGLSVEDTALALDVTSRTVKRDWAFARAWLFQRLQGT
ncbi:MAG: RNA polymerase subunit sigma-70 [Gemmatimonadetes bacterium]|nr:RNA polymerase subunit sigma-70 [Gemmatimonadota bacterium]